MKESKWREYRRNLPHMRVQGATYFVTWCIHPSQPELSPAERDLIVGSLRFYNTQHYDLAAFVVMNDHVHVLVTPRDGWTLENVVQPWKSFTAHVMVKKFHRVAPTWVTESFDRIM